MNKPVKKSKMGICSIMDRIVYFNADEETAKELNEFGRLILIVVDTYQLIIDARYDVDEVLEYIKSL